MTTTALTQLLATILVMAVVGCHTPPAVPRPDMASVAARVNLDWGDCGAVVVGAHTAVTPAHCVPESRLVLDGVPTWRGSCRVLQDLCDVDMPGAAHSRVAATRVPRRGELAYVTTPRAVGGTRVLDVSGRWNAAWIDWPCERGDSGGVAWGHDGAALCMLTGCAGVGGPTYCEILETP